MTNTIFERNGTTLTVKPTGELNSVTSPFFENELNERLTGVSLVVIDFAGVVYITSAGLRIILTLEKSLRKQNAEMKLIHVNEQIMEIFDLVGFADVIAIE